MNPTWQILPSPLTEDVFSPFLAPVALETARSVSTGFSGRGIMRPFRRNATGDFDVDTGVRLIRAEVGLVLGTICQSEETQGELPWRTEFGSLMPILRLHNNDETLQSMAQYYVVDALTRWVPAVRVTSSQIHKKGDPETLYLLITYDIVDPPSTRVIAPGIQTAVALG